MILRRRNTTLGDKAIPVTFLNTCPTWTSLIYMNGLVGQLLYIRIQCWIVGNITTVNLPMRCITVRISLWNSQCRPEAGEAGTNYRGPAVRTEARGPTVLQVFLRSCDFVSQQISFVIKPTRCTNFTNLFCHETLHVSDSSSVHHQEFIHCTLSSGICHTGL